MGVASVVYGLAKQVLERDFEFLAEFEEQPDGRFQAVFGMAVTTPAAADVILDLIARAREGADWGNDEIPTDLPSALEVTLSHAGDSSSLPAWMRGQSSLCFSLGSDDLDYSENVVEASASEAEVRTLLGEKFFNDILGPGITRDEVIAALWAGVDAALQSHGYELVRISVTSWLRESGEDTGRAVLPVPRRRIGRRHARPVEASLPWRGGRDQSWGVHLLVGQLAGAPPFYVQTPRRRGLRVFSHRSMVRRLQIGELEIRRSGGGIFPRCR